MAVTTLIPALHVRLGPARLRAAHDAAQEKLWRLQAAALDHGQASPAEEDAYFGAHLRCSLTRAAHAAAAACSPVRRLLGEGRPVHAVRSDMPATSLQLWGVAASTAAAAPELAALRPGWVGEAVVRLSLWVGRRGGALDLHFGDWLTLATFRATAPLGHLAGAISLGVQACAMGAALLVVTVVAVPAAWAESLAYSDPRQFCSYPVPPRFRRPEPSAADVAAAIAREPPPPPPRRPRP